METGQQSITISMICQRWPFVLRHWECRSEPAGCCPTEKCRQTAIRRKSSLDEHNPYVIIPHLKHSSNDNNKTQLRFHPIPNIFTITLLATMTEPTTAIPKGSWVLVTGANGFVASHVVRQFLDRGYKVRGTVRDLEKSSWLVEDVFKSFADNGDFELVVVPDLAVEGAFDDAVKGMSAIAHVATVTSLSPDPNTVVPQTVAGTTSILHAALKEPSVKSFAYTGSIVSSTICEVGITTHVERDTWNEAAVKLAWAPPPYELSRSMYVYSASKTEAEKAIFKFADEKHPHFRINSINPASIMGEPLNKKHLETPYAYLKSLYDGNWAFLAGIPSCMSLLLLLNNTIADISLCILIRLEFSG
jgi:NAD(P)-dependent dehydrogenase (short-subunit alcohol dehydrogenase family)